MEDKKYYSVCALDNGGMYTVIDDLNVPVKQDKNGRYYITWNKKKTFITPKVRVFIDIDGTMAEWKAAVCEEQLMEKGFFRYMKPNQAVVDAVSILHARDDIEVFSLSAYLTESPYALEEKNQWLDEFTPIPVRSRVYCPCGESKAAHVPGGIRPTDVLLDDYTLNLIDWSKYARAVKLMNGINGANDDKGIWTGPAIKVSIGGDAMAKHLAAYATEDRPLPPLEGTDTEDMFFIYQLKLFNGDWAYTFEPYQRLIASGYRVNGQNYDFAYAGELCLAQTLDDIIKKFSQDPPEDFKGRSLCVSDVIVLRRGNEETAYYVDSDGFQPVPEFLETRPKVKVYKHGRLKEGSLGYMELKPTRGAYNGTNIINMLCGISPSKDAVNYDNYKFIVEHALIKVYASDEDTAINHPSVSLIMNEEGKLEGTKESPYDCGGFGFGDREPFYSLTFNGKSLLAFLGRQHGKYLHIIAERL